MISIVSVPHTGTQFTEQILIGMGYDVRCTHVHSEHPSQNASDWINEGGPVVIPWRDPELARISAQNRRHVPRPLSEFDQLIEWSILDNVHLFEVDPGDEEDKAFELQKLQTFLESDIEPETDWQPINESEDVTGLKAEFMEARGP